MSDESEPGCAGLTCVRHEFALRQRVDALTAQLAEAGDVIAAARETYADDLRKRDEFTGDRGRRMDAELEAVRAARDDARKDRDALVRAVRQREREQLDIAEWHKAHGERDERDAERAGKRKRERDEAAGDGVDARRVREAEAERDDAQARADAAEAEVELVARQRDEASKTAERAMVVLHNDRVERNAAEADRDEWKARAEKAEDARDDGQPLVTRAELDWMTLNRDDLRDERDQLAERVAELTAERDEAGVSFEREGDGRWIAGVDALPGVLAYGATREAALASVQALARKVIAERDTAMADGHESGAEILVSCVHDMLWSKEHRGESVYHMAARCKRERDEALDEATKSESCLDAIAELLWSREHCDEPAVDMVARCMDGRNAAEADRDAWKERAEAAEAAITWTKLERDDSADRERLAIAEWHRVRDERDALVPRVRDGWDEEHAVLRRELEHVRKDRDAAAKREQATILAWHQVRDERDALLTRITTAITALTGGEA